MHLILRILSILAAIVFVLSTLVAFNIFWAFNYGDCKDGCGEGMAYILFLPTLILAGISGITAIGAHIICKRMLGKT